MLKCCVVVLAICIMVPVFFASPAFTQDTLWSRTYGGAGQWDYGQSVRQTADGGYIVGGRSNSFGAGEDDFYLVKTNSIGDTLWTRTYGGGALDFGESVQQTTDGGYIMVGETRSFGAGNYDVYLIKTDALGNTLWSRTYGDSIRDFGESVQQTTDGGYIIVGSTDSFGAGNYDVYLLKTDALGDTLWSRTYGGSDEDRGLCVKQTTDGGYIVAGYTISFGAGNYDFCLIKTNSSGDTLWTRTYGGWALDICNSVQQTTDGGYIMAGTSESFGAGSYDVCLIKTNSTGDMLWTRTYGGYSYDVGSSVGQIADGGYVVGGSTVSFSAGLNDVFVIRTNSSGDTVWTRAYGRSGTDLCASVQQTVDGSYVVAGYTESFGAGGMDVMLTRLDSLGNACIGDFVSPTVMSASPTVTSPATDLASPLTIVTCPVDTVTSPDTEIGTVCMAIAWRGDANGDGIIDLGDLVYLIGYLYKGGPPPDPLWTGDCNCDGIVNLGDVVYLISYLYKGGPPPSC